MLDNPILTRAMAVVVIAFGLVLAIYNTGISALVIAPRSGIHEIAAVGIAVGLTAVELWFASWARRVETWKAITKAFRRDPNKMSFQIFAFTVGLVLVYHYDIQSTYLAIWSEATDSFFFLWGVAWLVFGPEVTTSLGDWLWRKARNEQTRLDAANNHLKGEHAYRRQEGKTYQAMAASAGERDAIARARQRWGDQAATNGSGRFSE